MLTRVDHVMICVPDLASGIDAYQRLGFNIYPGGAHTGRATHNAIAFTGEEYLEVLSIRDRSAVAPGSADEGLARYLDAGGGFRVIALQSDDLEADVAAMRRRGVDVGEIRDGGRRTPAGQELRWRAAFPGPSVPLPIFFIQHLTPLEERRRQVAKAGDHPNGALRVDRVYITVRDVVATSRLCSRVLGLPEATIQRGAVIKADMAVFNLGPTGLTVAQPAEPGPAAEALARRGPGPFQVLYRTASMDAAVRWMMGRGLPEPIQGVRNTGERAILVGPEHTGGAYIGFVGPA
jgi:catechol 2,3-dioxygenase-like lactoylglutathione lyase family enzyme